jgi:inositol-1,4,5-trisphosphate 5-phosphatase
MYLIGIDEKKIFNNENYLIQKVISNIYKKISKSNIKLLKNENFVSELTKKLEKRSKELFVQYRPDMDTESIEKNQRMLDIIFGKIEKDLKQDFIYLREEFSIKEKIKLFIGSWNAGSTNLSKFPDLNLDSWLIPKNQEIIPNIYIVGFQEVVELNAGNIVLNLEDREKVLEAWAKKIENSIQKVGKYRKLIEMNLVGINIYCYCLEKDYENISNLTKHYVKTGFGGAGNKGSCCINFNYFSTSISVACSHLAAGEKKNKQRLKEISEVLKQKLSSFVKPDVMNISLDEDINPENKNENNENENDDGSSILFKDSDVWILFGDLNFRIDMEYEEFSEFIKDGQNWKKLLEYDQFNKNQKASIEFQEIIDEDPIVHPPSYKYILGTDSYDYDSKEKNEDEPNSNPNPNPNPNNTNLSGKKRNPSWCDRIFYKKNTYITKDEKKIIESLGYYNCVFDKSFQTSDHRPIFNIFEITVFKDDEEKKKKIEKEVEINNKLKISSKYLQTNIFDN